jgi:hypothetical protein
MKYAGKVVELLAAHPGRKFVMREIVRYVNPKAGGTERVAIKKAVQRVMVSLAATGNVSVTAPEKLGGHGRYSWNA